MSNMDAIILAAGKCSRFWPLNENGHKSQMRLFGKSILEHTIDNLLLSGVEDVVIVSHDGKIIEKAGIVNKNIKEVVQTEQKGMGDAVLKAKNAIGGDFFFCAQLKSCKITGYYQKMHGDAKKQR